MIRRLRLLLALAVALGGGRVSAHDMWIEPSSFSPVPGQAVALRLRVGQDLNGEPLALAAGLANRFVFQDAAASKPIVARLRADTAGLVRVARPGLQIVGYFSNPSVVDLPAQTFNAYLAEEGLDEIAVRRRQRNEGDAAARELYSRCAKTLMLAGPPDEAQQDVRLGFPLELVAERNPYALSAGEELPVRLTYEDKPLAGALVVAQNTLDPRTKQAARSDADGRVRFRVGDGGMWLVKTVHMVAAPADSGAHWASYWASLTFGSSAPHADP
jgi:uncharacterized GH25 family protein